MSKEPAARTPEEQRLLPPKTETCKLLEEMRKKPSGDWTIKDVETLCNKIGLAFKSPTRGSHYKVCATGNPIILTIPAKKPIKAPYIKLLVAMVDRFREARGE